jgi:hypothetical protein
MDVKNDWDAFKARLEYYKHLYDRVKLQEEVRDRWFRYYLLIMASTVTIMGFALREIGSAGQIPVFLSLLGIFIGMVGVIFFRVYLNQRYNYSVFLRQMKLLDDKFFYPTLVGPQLVSHMKKPLPPNPGGGADKNVLTLFLLTNSLVLAISALTLGQTFNISPTLPTLLFVVAFLASLVYHSWQIVTLSRALTERTVKVPPPPKEG